MNTQPITITANLVSGSTLNPGLIANAVLNVIAVGIHHQQLATILEAAPALLQACEALIDSTIQGHPDPKAKLMEAIATARLAVAKATLPHNPNT